VEALSKITEDAFFFKKILVATNGSQVARKATAAAIDLAKKYQAKPSHLHELAKERLQPCERRIIQDFC
jgi:nucleotide-binding universal stress UspA family protein